MYNTKFENVPDIFWAPGLALVPVPVKKVRRLKIASDVLVAALALVNMPNHGELTDDVHVHDPMHVSVFVYIISCYVHSFIVLLLAF